MMEKLKDMGRRSRIGKRQPKGSNVILNDIDTLRLQKLHQYGHLPTPYIHAFTKNWASDYQSTQKRMNLIYHETGLLMVPKQQNRAPNSRTNYLVYGISSKGEDYLDNKGLYSEQAPVIGESDQWFHDFMASCVTASFDLGTPECYNFIPQCQLLSKYNTHLSFPISFIEPKTGRNITIDLKPDRVNKIYLPSGKKLILLLEVERSKKQHTYVPGRKTTERNCLQYFEFVGRGHYRNHFNDKECIGAIVLFVYWDYGTMIGAIKQMKKVLPSGKSQFMLFMHLPNFDIDNFKPPSILDTLWNGPWLRAGHPPVCLVDL